MTREEEIAADIVSRLVSWEDGVQDASDWRVLIADAFAWVRRNGDRALPPPPLYSPPSPTSAAKECPDCWDGTVDSGCSSGCKVKCLNCGGTGREGTK